MRHEPTTDELPIIGKTVELPDSAETTELPAKPSSTAADSAKSSGGGDSGAVPERRTVKLTGEGLGGAAEQPRPDDGPTAELPAQQQAGQQQARRHRPEMVQQVAQGSSAPRKRGRFWREVAGALAVGTVLLATAVLVLQVVAWVNGMPGLGIVVLLGHLGGAALAVAAQRIVDRRGGRPALLAGLGLGVTVVAILVLFWWI
ncbi:hypothetical protein JOF56_001092 [Kibdelosporangium banguiense]|uniref:Uncharacterized protein n=1 Tax=Kibdelosporangium banguiense TaxID=1365924 RepID=A0ABS4T8G9_9PSEU|nr:hypothetical protein [Kibdelosporangium banguiense]MBP2320707.1 hypothetical protein [Kibdelosporangium banguiense]